MRALWRLCLGLVVACLALAVMSIYVPNSPLPEAWNPRDPLKISDPITPLTEWKLRAALTSPAACHAALRSGDVGFEALADFEESPVCHIRNRVAVLNTGQARVKRFDTTCAIALRMAMWDRHGLQPAAQARFGQGVREIRHYSSYNCRAIRTSAGTGTRMSTHATARSVDVSGFVLEDGATVDLRRDWDDAGPKAAFLRDAQSSACDLFGLVLGPEYNALHADHFHIQLDWQGCR